MYATLEPRARHSPVRPSARKNPIAPGHKPVIMDEVSDSTSRAVLLLVHPA